MELTDRYEVHKITGPFDVTVTVPGSKSMTNRALLMAALSDGVTEVSGILFSDDSRVFLDALKTLGFEVYIDEENRSVKVTGCCGRIPQREAEVYVGSAGTAARFITAMLALSDGTYTVRASAQMEKRPMKPLFDALAKLGASIEYIKEEGRLPVVIRGCQNALKCVELDISKSTQFLSALLMMAPMLADGLDIHITSEKTDGAYIRITREMMREFGCIASYDGHDYHVPGGQVYHMESYMVEPDVSAACYFYAMAAVTGGSALVRGVYKNLMQGDMKFINVLSDMGCTVSYEAEGIKVTGPLYGLKGIDVDMNDFSDQTMTLAAIAPFASGETKIRNIAHISGQESDRLAGIIENLSRLGIRAYREGNGIVIIPGRCKPCVIETYEDHRMAMAFAIPGLMTDGVIINNPMCCRKTFENYFEILNDITG